jgi:protein-S-isoprenylcysteine O-methyltransferase Ste14
MSDERTAVEMHQSNLLHRGAFFGAALVALLGLVGVSLLLRGEPPATGEFIWLAGFAATSAIRYPHVRANRQNAIVGDRHDFSEKILLPAMFLAMLALPLMAIATPVLDFADYDLPSWAPWAALPLQVGYVWLFWRSHTDLGSNWSPGLEVRAGHGLVDQGVYARIRHPMYAAIWLGAAAQPLLVHNWLGGAFILVAFAAMYVVRVPREEAMMVDTFGDRYRDYMARTGRIWPR